MPKRKDPKLPGATTETVPAYKPEVFPPGIPASTQEIPKQFTSKQSEIELTKMVKKIIDSYGSTPVTGRSYGTSDTSIAGGFSPEKVAYNNNQVANGISWDGPNHRWVCVTPGRYRVVACVGYTSTTSGKQYEIAIYVNTTGQQGTDRRQAGATGGVLTLQATDEIDLAIDDYVEAYTQHNDTGSETISTGSIYTYITITKI